MTEGSIDKKAEGLLSVITEALNRYLPERVIRVASDDEPWFSEQLKTLDRRRRRKYNKNRRSSKYPAINDLYKEKWSKTKKKYKRDQIDDLKAAKSGEWYSHLKRMTRYDQHRAMLVFSYKVEQDQLSERQFVQWLMYLGSSSGHFPPCMLFSRK